MNSRRLIASPEAQDKASSSAQTSTLEEGGHALRGRTADVRFGSEADICADGEMMKNGTQGQIDRLTQAFLPMKKFNIAILKQAYQEK
jgi:hypothetical protein